MKFVHQKDTQLVTISLAILACLLWSTAFVGVKIGLRYSDPFSFAGTRFMLAGLILVPFWWKRRSTFRVIQENIKIIFLIGFFQTFIVYGLFYLGMTMVSGALAAIIIGASPLTAALVAHFLMANDVMTRPKMISLCLGIVGIVILSVSRLPWVSPTGFVEFGGIVLLFICTLSSALGNVLVAGKKCDLDPVLLNSLQIFLGGVLLFCVSVYRQGIPVEMFPFEYYVVLLWLSFLSAVAFSLWFVLLKRPGVKVSQLNLWKFIIPVFGAILSWLFLPDESPHLSSVMGMVCIAVSIIFFHITDRRQVGLS